MKFSPLWWVIIGLAAVIVLLLIFNKDPEPNAEKIKALEYGIAIIEQEKADLKAKHQEDSLKFAQELARLNAELKAKGIHTVKLERSLAKIRANPVIVKIRDSIKVVDDAFITYDSTLAAKNEEIRIQGRMITSLEEENKRITDNFIQRLNLSEQAFQDQKQLADIYKKDLRKQRRKTKLATVLIPVVGVAALLLGAGL